VGFEKFAYQRFTTARPFDAASTPLVSTPSIVGNLPTYHEAAAHSGYLVNAAEEPDDVLRRATLVMFPGGRAYPSPPLGMARVRLGEAGLGSSRSTVRSGACSRTNLGWAPDRIASGP